MDPFPLKAGHGRDAGSILIQFSSSIPACDGAVEPVPERPTLPVETVVLFSFVACREMDAAVPFVRPMTIKENEETLWSGDPVSPGSQESDKEAVMRKQGCLRKIAKDLCRSGSR